MKLFRCTIFFFCLFLLSGCDNWEIPFFSKPSFTPGVVASVNDVPIYLADLERRRVALTGVFDNVPLENRQILQEHYQYVLRQMIQEEIILQYMDRKGIKVSEEKIQEEKQVVLNDYTTTSFSSMLAEQGLTQYEWEAQLRRRVSVEYFFTTVIRPTVVISQEEVSAYVEMHMEEFTVPEQWTFFQLSGMDKQEVTKAQQTLLLSRNATETQSNFDVVIRDVRVNVSSLLDDHKKMLEKLQIWQGSSVRKSADEYIAFVLIDKTPSSQMSPAAIYERVERVLGEEKMREVFSAWLEKWALKSRVYIHKDLLAQTPDRAVNATSN